VLIERKQDSRNVKNIKRTRLLKIYNIEKEENLAQLIEELKQKVSAKTRRLSRYKKRQNQY
jgi:vacuolar-type H+-ATPase subunit I/STV1